MAHGVVRGLEPVDVDISGDDLSTVALGAIDLASNGSQPGTAAAHSRQLVGPGIFTVPRRLRAILRRNLAVVTALCAIVRRDLPVVDCPYAAIRSSSALRGRAGTSVLCALTIARRAIPCGSVEIPGSVIARFGITVAQPGRDVTVPRSQAGLPTAHRCFLVGPGIFAVLRCLGAIFGCDFAVVDGSYAAVGSLGAPRICPRTFISRALAVAHRAVPRSSVAITCGIVTRFGLSVTQPGRDVAVTRSQSGFPTAHCRQLIGAGILAVLRRLGAIVRCHLAVVDGSFAAIRGIGATRVGPRALVCGAPAVARGAIACNSVELSGRVVTGFGVSITQLGGKVACPRRQARIFTILGGLGAILSCKPAVVDGLGAVIRRLSASQCGLGAFVCHPPPVAGGAIACGSVKITGRIVTGFGLPVTQPGCDITVLSGHPRLTTPSAYQLVGP